MTERQIELMRELVVSLDDGTPHPPMRILGPDDIPLWVREGLLAAIRELNEREPTPAPTRH